MRLPDGVADRECSPGRCIELVPVMHFDDLGIVFLSAGSAAAMRAASSSTSAIPAEKLAACTTATCRDACATAAWAASDRPVVPTTHAALCREMACAWADADAGTVKSITASEAAASSSMPGNNVMSGAGDGRPDPGRSIPPEIESPRNLVSSMSRGTHATADACNANPHHSVAACGDSAGKCGGATVSAAPPVFARGAGGGGGTSPRAAH